MRYEDKLIGKLWSVLPLNDNGTLANETCKMICVNVKYTQWRTQDVWGAGVEIIKRAPAECGLAPQRRKSWYI